MKQWVVGNQKWWGGGGGTCSPGKDVLDWLTWEYGSEHISHHSQGPESDFTSVG